MRTGRVKICGLTTLDDALGAARAGVDMLGLNFYRKSPRFLEVEAARTLAAALRRELGADCPLLIGLFVNEPVGRIQAVVERVGLNGVQLSGDESVEMLSELRGLAYKAIRPRSAGEAVDDIAYFLPSAPASEALPSLLVDAHHAHLYGGTGEQANPAVVEAARERVSRLMLAGGLTPENVGAAVDAVQPWGVDVASGVECDGQPGRKDAGRIAAFVQAARGL